jgi:hypothetical protein
LAPLCLLPIDHFRASALGEHPAEVSLVRCYANITLGVMQLKSIYLIPSKSSEVCSILDNFKKN